MAYKKINAYFFIPITLLLLGIVHGLIGIELSVNFLDEGFNYEVTQRILQGEVPYRDVYFFSTPLFFYISALMIKLTSLEVSSLRYLGTVVSSIHALLIYHIVQKLYNNHRLSLIAWVCTLALGLHAGLLLYHYSWFAVTFSLATLVCLIHWETSKKNLWLLLGGMCVGLTILTKQTVGAYTLAAVISYFVTQKQMYGNTLRSHISQMYRIVLGICIPIGIWLAYAYHVNALIPFVQNSFINPLTMYTGISVDPPTLADLKFALQQFNMVSLFPVMYWLGLFVTFTPFIAAAVGQKNLPKTHVLVGQFLIFNFMQNFERSSMLITQSITGLVIVQTIIFTHYFLGSVSRRSYNKILLNTFLVAILLLLITTDLKLSFFNNQKYVIQGLPEYRVTKDEAQRYNAIMTDIAPYVSDVDDIFVYPHTPMVYIMLNKHNPTPTSLMIVGHLNSDMERQTIRSLHNNKTQFIIFNEPFIIDGMHFHELYPDLQRYIDMHYKAVYAYDEKTVLLERL